MTIRWGIILLLIFFTLSFGLRTPVSVILGIFKDRLPYEVQGHGDLFHGELDKIVFSPDLEMSLSWDFLKVMWNKLEYDVTLELTDITASGKLEYYWGTSSVVILKALHFQGAWESLPQAWQEEIFQPQGRIEGNFERVFIQQGQFLPKGTIVWQDASIFFLKRIPLGQITGIISPTETQAIQTTITNQQGILDITGQITVTFTGFYEIDLLLQENSTTSQEIKYFLASLGTAEGNGRRLYKKGTFLPSQTPEATVTTTAFVLR